MISLTSEYGLRAVVFLSARESSAPASAQEISEAINVPAGYLQKVLRALAKNRILVAQRGIGGGFKLGKVTSAISVLDIIRATDASLSRIEECPLGISGHRSLCALHKLIDQQIAIAEQAFAATSIADLMTPKNSDRSLCTPAETTRVDVAVPRN